jgi:hypothetical protein
MILVATSDLSVPVFFLFILWDYVPTFCVLFTLNLHHEEEAGGRERRRRRKERQEKLERRRKRQPSYGSMAEASADGGRGAMNSVDIGWDDHYAYPPSDAGAASFSPHDENLAGAADEKRSIPDYGVFSMIANSGEVVKSGQKGRKGGKGPRDNSVNPAALIQQSPAHLSGASGSGRWGNANP